MITVRRVHNYIDRVLRLLAETEIAYCAMVVRGRVLEGVVAREREYKVG